MRAIDQFELDTWWTVVLNTVSIGTYSNSQQYFAIIDTGTSFSILGISDYLEFATEIYNIGGSGRNFNCAGAFCYAIKSCDKYYDMMPTLSFTF